MQENNSQIAKNILKKFKKAINIKTDTELAEILNIKSNTISSWKKRNTLDYAKIIEKCIDLNIDLNFLFLNNYITTSYESLTPIISKDLIYQYTNGTLRDSLKDLPFMKFPCQKNKESIAFQIEKDDNNTSKAKDTFAICEKTIINNVSEDDNVFIISKKVGFFKTKIKPSNIDSNFLILNIQSDSSFNNNVTISLNDIDEIWVIKGMLTIY